MNRQVFAKELENIANSIVADNRMTTLRWRTINDVDKYIDYAMKNVLGLTESPDIRVRQEWEAVLESLDIARRKAKIAQRLEKRTDDLS